MKQENCNILSIVPYRFLPPTSGGHLGIALPHHYLGLRCNDHIITTIDNIPDKDYSFTLHKILTTKKHRYRPFYKRAEMLSIAKEKNINYIYCDHPYMALTAISLSKELKVPWYMRSHNIESERFRSYGKRWWPVMHYFEKKIMQKANGLLFVTPEDKKWAVEKYGIHEKKGHVIPYGTTLNEIPQGHDEAKKKVASLLQIDENKHWLYFLGAMDFYPNENALSFILDEIIPRLNKRNISYQVLVAGKGLKEHQKRQIDATDNIKYVGFIPDLDDFLKANDVMLNSVLLGGGIKTKAVEALGYNKVVVSTFSGSAGLLQNACGDNLYVSADNDWDTFTDNIIKAITAKPSIPHAFYDTYYWGNIAKNILTIFSNPQ
jgi:polysaccharide biosynthesis protein PslH